MSSRQPFGLRQPFSFVMSGSEEMDGGASEASGAHAADMDEASTAHPADMDGGASEASGAHAPKRSRATLGAALRARAVGSKDTTNHARAVSGDHTPKRGRPFGAPGAKDKRPHKKKQQPAVVAPEDSRGIRRSERSERSPPSGHGEGQRARGTIL